MGVCTKAAMRLRGRQRTATLDDVDGGADTAPLNEDGGLKEEEAEKQRE